LPDDGRLLVSDYTTIAEQSETRLRFIRTISEGSNYKHCSPGSRVGILTNATSVKFTIYYNNLVALQESNFLIGYIYVDGISTTSFTNPAPGSAAEVIVNVEFLSIAERAIELVWPYGAGMDLLKVGISGDATVISLPPARPVTKIQFFGDSITHGFSATSISNTWAFKVANTKNYQMISSGYGGLTAQAAFGSLLANSDIVVVMIGVNNCAIQQDLVSFKAAYKSMLENIRTLLPAAVIYAVTPIYSGFSGGAIPLSDYRVKETEAVNEIADANTTLIDGLTLMTNSADRLSEPTGSHPNNLGASEIATNLAALIL
jgi:lysophospholipase L1-like esterase